VIAEEDRCTHPLTFDHLSHMIISGGKRGRRAAPAMELSFTV
jgi:hypothetical protein